MLDLATAHRLLAVSIVAALLSAGCSHHTSTARGPLVEPDRANPVQHLHGATRVVLTPTEPEHGVMTHLVIHGRARGGGYLFLQSIKYGDGDVEPFKEPSCPAVLAKPPYPQHGFAVGVSYTWPRAGSYDVKATLVPGCASGLTGRTVRFQLTVL